MLTSATLLYGISPIFGFQPSKLKFQHITHADRFCVFVASPVQLIEVRPTPAKQYWFPDRPQMLLEDFPLHAIVHLVKILYIQQCLSSHVLARQTYFVTELPPTEEARYPTSSWAYLSLAMPSPASMRTLKIVVIEGQGQCAWIGIFITGIYTNPSCW